jgi:hypothetical protein
VGVAWAHCQLGLCRALWVSRGGRNPDLVTRAWLCHIQAVEVTLGVGALLCRIRS